MIIRFVHVPKTAGVSILEALRKSISSIETKQLSDCTKKIDGGKESWEIRGSNGTYHSKASEVSVKVVDNYKDFAEKKRSVDFSFSFIRNPWDRFVSSYIYLSEKQNDEYEEYIKPFKSFKDFAINGSIDSLHFRPQTYWIDAPINFVGRFEELQSHFDGLCKTIGLSTQKLKKMNSTRHESYLDYYDTETIKAVGCKYEEDITLLGYSLEGYTHPS